MKRNLQIVTDHYVASARGDLEGMLVDVSPHVRWVEMAGFPCAGTWFGPEQVVEHVFKVLASEWTDYRFTLERVIDGGEFIVGLGHYSGTFIKTGKSMSVRVCHVWRLADGKIVAFEQFTDTLLVAQAMSDV